MNESTDSLKLANVSGRDGLASSLSTLADHLCGLVATETSTPLATLVLVLVREVGLSSADEGREFTLVLRLNVLESKDGCGLLVDDGTETGLALYDDVGDTHLAAESGEEDNELDGVDIVGDDDEGSLLGLNKSNDVVKTVLDEEGLLGLILLSLSNGGSSLSETGLLLLLRLGAVLVEELEELGSGVLVQGVGELGNGGWNLQALVEDDLLALEADILGPLDEAGEVSLRADVLADTEVLGGRLEERVLLSLGGLARREGSSGGLLSRSYFGLGGHFCG